MARDQHFDVPQQLRELAERNVEQTRGVYCQIMNAMAQATSMWLDAIPSNEMTLDLKAVHERAVRFAKQNAETSSALRASLPMLRTCRTFSAIRVDLLKRKCRPMSCRRKSLGG